MKATELMIGDWVKLMNPKGECIDYVKIDANLFGIFLRDGEEGFVRFGPIPLTAEILENNGWDVSAYSMLKVSQNKWLEYYHHEGRLRLWWKGIDEWQNHAEVKEVCFECELHYIHELQHALRLCGLNDLADSIII